MTRVRIEDLRPAGICPRARLFWEQQGWDWRDFVKNGIDPETLRATGDARAEMLIEIARRREARGG